MAKSICNFCKLIMNSNLNSTLQNITQAQQVLGQEANKLKTYQEMTGTKLPYPELLAIGPKLKKVAVKIREAQSNNLKKK